ncbi:HlyD family secretion protein [Shewanella sp. 1_MG-2023]|uniref:efflux RND transporter periplasmic adaptor subunit n=1 Tax=unclassified Shewanella TaxID=196818 RepID=UPI0026E2A0C0|nr:MULTISPECIES: HlyD family secretion protein [unclassified Shewanella]MDO6611273.1 HlyD family secretion protein [Shewanella sp. 7_MG-2023]MDO6771128.1 HlyD family secretion protein [Shewanella sp. 2_MG-2023]MDO6796631.1 HlyD family secretion protein [Shewanella sp. 1_MG-2023]
MFRIITTLVMVAIAAIAVLSQYQNYAENPWTRDGQVRAHIIQITPRVTGPVTNVLVDDNSRVKKGQLLFEIDPSIYQAELSNAKAKQMQASALVDKAKNENHRAVELESLKHGTVSELDLNNFQNAVQTAKANLAAADAVVEQAELNVAYTHVTAPTDGFITNLNLRQGAQVVANNPVVALIDENSFWIEGFFKETDLQGVNMGDEARVTLMMNPDSPIEAKVESIGFGIAKSDGSTGNTLLPNVNPNFQWIRLAQRIPVKIHIEHVPEDVQLRVGTTASVQIFNGA